MSRSPRPRDPLGRPLPRGSAPVEPDPSPLPPIETLDVGEALLAAGRAFRAHEVFEARWKAAATGDRELWRGLAQLAVGITHAQRGNRHGAVALLRRAAVTLQPWEHETPHDVNVAALRRWCGATADGIAAGSALDVVEAPPLRRSGG